jgi:hypothetical protein
MKEELRTLEKNNTWIIVSLPREKTDWVQINISIPY